MSLKQEERSWFRDWVIPRPWRWKERVPPILLFYILCTLFCAIGLIAEYWEVRTWDGRYMYAKYFEDEVGSTKPYTLDDVDNQLQNFSWETIMEEASFETSRFKFKLIYDRRSVGQSILLSGSHLEPMTRFLFSVWWLRVSWCGAPSLTRGWVCNLFVQLLLVLARAVTLGFKSRRPTTIVYCLIWDYSNLEGQVPVFISPRNRVVQLYPRVLSY
jgi:hypothetical protein